MTTATDSKAAATLSGRELALRRRQAMATHGKAAVKKTAQVGSQAQDARMQAAYVAPAQETAQEAYGLQAASSNVSASENEIMALARQAAASTRKASRLRREATSTVGKAALKPTASRPTGRVRSVQNAMNLMADQSAENIGVAMAADIAPAKSCGCGCNGQKGGCGDVATAPAQNFGADAEPVLAARQNSAPTGRALARARRVALSQDGKAGLKRVAQATKIAASVPGQDWQTAMTKGATGRQVAMQRRVVQALAGRTEVANTRPTGRVRARMETPVPAKVEVGHTLSGQGVTGTMVERSKKTTGNEPGSCRAITGTEYIGAEQYDALCERRSAPAPAKVGVSHTARDRAVTGTEVGRSGKVTGDEPGACRGITGTEYLAAERYQEFCSSKPAPGALKVGATQTHKGETLTGTLVERSSKVTGNEPGSDRNLTGTRYMASAADTAPDKVAVTHTADGKVVTGTAVGHTAKITGDEPGACRGITGTEYLAQEQFTAVCSTAAPASPRKVSIMSSRDNMEVSGTNVGRSDKVTGDEPGSCRNITGNQYYTQADFGGACSAASPRKVSAMQTLAGRTVTGTEVAPSPKLSGDESYGCKPVTGIDYVGTQQLAAVCDARTPNISPVAKVVVDQTLRGMPVTGSYAGRSGKVTGNEFGGCSPISGTPYIGRSQYNGFCASDAIAGQNALIRDAAPIQSITVTGDRPGAGGSVMTGDERGACGSVSGTPYIGLDTMPGACPTSGRFVPRRSALPEIERAPAPLDFSIVTPARAAQTNRSFSDVTGNGGSDRITGPVNKAGGLITGTPEFRHRAADAVSLTEQDRIAAARRVTGEGSQDGRTVTGDAWSALSRVSGTEGTSSLVRNMSERGMPRGMGVSARHFGEVIERPEIPESRITGSSGNTGKGAAVTLSGGARG